MLTTSPLFVDGNKEIKFNKGPTFLETPLVECSFQCNTAKRGLHWNTAHFGERQGLRLQFIPWINNVLWALLSVAHARLRHDSQVWCRPIRSCVCARGTDWSTVFRLLCQMTRAAWFMGSGKVALPLRANGPHGKWGNSEFINIQWMMINGSAQITQSLLDVSTRLMYVAIKRYVWASILPQACLPAG